MKRLLVLLLVLSGTATTFALPSAADAGLGIGWSGSFGRAGG